MGDLKIKAAGLEGGCCAAQPLWIPGRDGMEAWQGQDAHLSITPFPNPFIPFFPHFFSVLLFRGGLRGSEPPRGGPGGACGTARRI